METTDCLRNEVSHTFPNTKRWLRAPLPLKVFFRSLVVVITFAAVTVTATSFDLRIAAADDAFLITAQGVGVSDLSAWIADFGNVGTSGYKGRSDFNHDGVIAVQDLSFWISRFGSATSTSGCFGVSYCTP